MTLVIIMLFPLILLPNVKYVRLLTKNEYLLKILTKFTIGRDNLDVLLAQKNACLIKLILDTYMKKKTKFFKNFFFNFIKVSNTPFTRCHYCMYKDYSSINCLIKKYEITNAKYK